MSLEAPAGNLLLPVEALTMLGKALCAVDADARVVLWNGRLEQLGISSARAQGQPLEAVLGEFNPEHPRLPALLEAIRGALDQRRITVLRNVALNFPSRRGQMFHVVVAPDGARPGHAIVLLRDVTEDARTREQFERILDSTPDGVFVIDPDRRVRLFNKACGEITGRDPREVLHGGSSCSEVVRCHTEDGESYAASLCPAKDVFRGEVMNQREEMLLTNASGQERWVETTYSPVLAEDGSVEFVIGMLRDVHDRKMLEERLHQSEKLASLGQLVAGIAHEIKNPLAIIQSSVDVLENPARSAEQRAEAAGFIREEVRRLDGRLRAFLSFARPRPLQSRPMLLTGLAQRRAAALGTLFPAVNFVTEMPPPAAIVMGDEEQLGQVLTNLAVNAAEAMEGRGTVTIRVRQQGDYAVLEVEDEGPGVSPDHASRIFDPFFTTKADGTGLGLAISYQILLAHRGTISVGPGRGGRGALFTLRLPAAATAPR